MSMIRKKPTTPPMIYPDPMVMPRVVHQHQDLHGDNRNLMQQQIFQIIMHKNHLLMEKRFLMEQKEVYVPIITRTDLV